MPDRSLPIRRDDRELARRLMTRRENLRTLSLQKWRTMLGKLPWNHLWLLLTVKSGTMQPSTMAQDCYLFIQA